MLIAALLLGFRLQALPEYRIGDIAGQQVIAPQDVIYEDKQATASRREAARDRTPALYELEVDRIADAREENTACLRRHPASLVSSADSFQGQVESNPKKTDAGVDREGGRADHTRQVLASDAGSQI